MAPFCPCVKLLAWDFKIVSTGGLGVMTVESVVLAEAEPPPETDTAFDKGVPALLATFTVTVIAGKLLPPLSTLLVVQVGNVVQFHPVPDIETKVMPAGTVSVMVTTPEVGPAPAVLLTVTV